MRKETVTLKNDLISDNINSRWCVTVTTLTTLLTVSAMTDCGEVPGCASGVQTISLSEYGGFAAFLQAQKVRVRARDQAICIL